MSLTALCAARWITSAGRWVSRRCLMTEVVARRIRILSKRKLVLMKVMTERHSNGLTAAIENKRNSLVKAHDDEEEG